MVKQKRIAIMGAGNIAGVMAKTIKKMKHVKCYAIASRDLGRAKEFAKKYGVKKAYGSYEEMVQDPKIDLVYIATPHSEHYQNMKLCIECGKAVLCEKAFTANAEQAEEIFQLAKEKGVFVTEAIWTRYMPFLSTIRGIVSSGMIGTPSMLTCNLGYHLVHVPRLMQPELAGGALLDVGVYTLNFAAMLFGADITRVTSSCTMTPTGVDASNSVTITYRDGRMAVLNSTMLGMSDRRGIIYGTNGYVEIENINNFESITVYDNSRKVIKSVKAPKQISGYEYEVISSLNAIDRGQLECWEMPHAETVRIMRMMDDLRKAWGIVYPFEVEATMESESVEETEVAEVVEEALVSVVNAPMEEIPAAIVEEATVAALEEMEEYTPLFVAEAAKESEVQE
ncbi:MAG: Gfo/Idh/MocA family oxidoreductase [Lachnospiraceae bacterium]|nr:Gfo/Idh/MocA family oxidoreductase [Lachnospiraceae bacterium]